MFLLFEGSGPLKSTANLSKGVVDLIRLDLSGLTKRGLVSAQILQSLVILRTSSNEYGKFLDLTK